MTLSTRRQNVLQALINEYIESAHPVGSKRLVSHYLVDVSSATVRNELMWLEDRGYVISPHTSSGRIPTNVGYRCFVNSLLLRPDMIQIQAQVGESRNIQKLRNSLLESEPVDYLQTVINALMFLSSYVGCLAVAWTPKLSPTVHHRGLVTLLSQPEFHDTTTAIPLIQLLESHGDLLAILNEVQSTPGLHIRIGTEHADSQLYAFSMVASRVGYQGTTGVIALFGPTRMDYRKAISALSAVISDIQRRP